MTRYMAGGPDPRAVFPPRSYQVTYRPASAEDYPCCGDFEKTVDALPFCEIEDGVD